ncbi:unnamed protein product [Protopolystoma xenopodis]|uniref:Uncharacterized protein n=1 Tax=Protopolystoma xenopodis TaxID=117903 RepID=A0A448WGG2_9PLAT|nr:unnamed protein product [Protopolystoma xenopodis]
MHLGVHTRTRLSALPIVNKPIEASPFLIGEEQASSGSSDPKNPCEQSIRTNQGAVEAMFFNAHIWASMCGLASL